MNRQMNRLRSRSWLGLFVLLIVALLPLQTAQAGDNFVGDGFGGREWYVPSGMEASLDVGAYVDPTGQLYMWGNKTVNFPTILPVPDVTTTHVCSYPVAGFDDVQLVSLSEKFGVLVNNDDTAYFWGSAGNNPDGGLTYNQTGEAHVKTPQQVLTDVKHISTGMTHMAFVKNDGTVWSIGANTYGAFGVGTTDANFVTTPVQMTGMTDAVRVATFGRNASGQTRTRAATLVLKSDGTLWIAGGGGSALLSGTSTNYTATQLNITNVVDIDTGLYHAMALTTSGDLYTWGWDYYSVTGHGNVQGTDQTVLVPTKVNFPIGTPPLVAIDTDEEGYNSFALDATGTLWAWGYQVSAGMMGIGTSNTIRAPYPVATNVADVTSGPDLAFMVRDSAYPTASRLWWASAPSVARALTLNLDLAPTGTGGTPTSTNDTNVIYGSNTWTISKPETCDMAVDFSGMPGAAGGGTTTATADVAIVKSAEVSEAMTGVAFDYTLTVTNNGPDDATNVVATDTLPAGFTLNSASATGGGSCSESGGTVTCSWATLANGATVSATINVTP